MYDDADYDDANDDYYPETEHYLHFFLLLLAASLYYKSVGNLTVNITTFSTIKICDLIINPTINPTTHHYPPIT